MCTVFFYILYIYIYVNLISEKFYVIYLHIIECILTYTNEIFLLYIPWIIFYYIYFFLLLTVRDKYKLSFLHFIWIYIMSLINYIVAYFPFTTINAKFSLKVYQFRRFKIQRLILKFHETNFCLNSCWAQRITDEPSVMIKEQIFCSEATINGFIYFRTEFFR